MKKLLLLFILAGLGLLSCSPEEAISLTEPVQASSINKNSMREAADDWPCPPGYHFQVIKNLQLIAFKTFPSCSSGFGSCVIRFTLTFDCVRNTVPSKPSPETLQQLAVTSSTSDVLFYQRDDNFVDVWFPAAIQNSSAHVPSDFNSFTIGDINLNNQIQLTAGTYPKTTIGNYIVYTVPFTRI